MRMNVGIATLWFATGKVQRQKMEREVKEKEKQMASMGVPYI